jgi:hypothetical protein
MFNKNLDLLPAQIEKLYLQLTEHEILAINEALTFEHADFHLQVRRLDAVDRQLAKRFFAVFSVLNKKLQLFSKELRFFYFWRISVLLHYLEIKSTFRFYIASTNYFHLMSQNQMRINSRLTLLLSGNCLVRTIKNSLLRCFRRLRPGSKVSNIHNALNLF